MSNLLKAVLFVFGVLIFLGVLITKFSIEAPVELGALFGVLLALAACLIFDVN